MFYGIMKIEGLEQGASEVLKKNGNPPKSNSKVSMKKNGSDEEKPRQFYSSPCLLPELEEED